MNRAAIVTDEHLLTSVPNVYAVGDCNGKLMLAHTAYREAEVAVNHMLGIKDEMRYDAIPSVIYTAPEVASVGETKASAEKKGMLTLIKTQAQYNGIETTYPGPAHLSLGQEASCVGEAYLLDKDDFTFGSHRSHSEILAKSLSCIQKMSDKELMAREQLAAAGE